MSRPRKSDQNSANTAEKKPREKRINPTPYRVYFKHFVSNLSLGAILNGKEVTAVFMCDSVTHNYSDVTEIDALSATARKMFKSRKEQSALVATFASGTYAKEFMEKFMEARSQDVVTETPLTIETISQ